MPTNDLTPNELLPRPHTDNTVAADFARLIDMANALDAKLTELRGLIAGKAASSHTHAIANVSGLQGALDSKQLLSWRPTLDDLLNVSVSGAALGQVLRYDGSNWIPNTLSVDWADISSKPSSFASAWADVTGKPSTFTPAAHSHSIPDVTGLQAALDGKAPSSHAHAITDVTGLQSALDGKLSLAGGTVSGSLTLPASTLFAKQGDPNEGGEIRLQLASGSSLAGGSLIVDVSGNNFRILEAASPFKGIYAPIALAASGVGSEITTNTWIGAHLAAMALSSLGETCFAAHVGAAIGYGTIVAGSDLRASSHVGNLSTTINNGSWRCQGEQSGASQGTQYKRVA